MRRATSGFPVGWDGKMKRRGAIVAVAAVAAIAPAQVRAQQTAVPTFTVAQADAGSAAYVQACAACHLPNLRGSFEAPELAGANFRNTWGSRPVSALFTRIRDTMPPQSPRSLGEETYVAITAYILSQNGIAPGTAALTAASSATIAGAAAEVAAGAPAEIVYPAPGRPGNTPSPAGIRLGAPVSRGEVTETPTAHTTTLRPVDDYLPVTDADLADPPDGDWLHWRGSPGSTGYTPLDQIDPETVDDLELAWVWGMHPGTNNQAPLVRDGVLYLINAWNIVQALDAADGTLLWEYRRKFTDGRETGGFGLGGQTRSIAIWDDMVYVATRDAALVALDARTGQVRWEAQLGDPERGYTNAHGPIVADGKVINGINGCERFYETSCFITAHDGRTGEELWRTFTIARPGEPGGDTWGDLPFELRGGGDVWNGGSWDPELGLVYFGVAQAKPWVPASRGLTTADAALYTNSTLALDVETGRIAWYRQHTSGEALDLDEAMEQVLVDIGPQPALLTIGKPGILWKLDRRNGRYLGLTETIFQNALSVDRETGTVRYRDDIRNARVGEWLSVCPATAGGKNWQATSYDPGSGLLVVPLYQTCMEMSGREVELVEGSGGIGADRMFLPAPGVAGIGKLAAYNVQTMEEAWSLEQEAAFTSAILTTGGGIAFVGDFDRWLRAFDVRTGEVLWRTRLGSTIMGFPISFEVDGVQHVAVSTNQGGGSPWQFPSAITPEMQAPAGHNALYVFRLKRQGN